MYQSCQHWTSVRLRSFCNWVQIRLVLCVHILKLYFPLNIAAMFTKVVLKKQMLCGCICAPPAVYLRYNKPLLPRWTVLSVCSHSNHHNSSPVLMFWLAAGLEWMMQNNPLVVELTLRAANITRAFANCKLVLLCSHAFVMVVYMNLSAPHTVSLIINPCFFFGVVVFPRASSCRLKFSQTKLYCCVLRQGMEPFHGCMPQKSCFLLLLFLPVYVIILVTFSEFTLFSS